MTEEEKNIIHNLQEENKKIMEKVKQIDNVCDLALDGATNWDEEQLEELLKQIKRILKS
ncbi:hypothetical protein SAMN04487977_101504 [Treponema bryantii]|uniref:Uncharacterized protein n=1 Tax=Treponema bryantii TaxID=163 RepID=A0A1H9AXW6_9SPIR|nr:hypothetical protein [Treponema bryantii]SEP81365.1 hypothetical protein SAMN04487977_101504 [Treponema bryantii]